MRGLAALIGFAFCLAAYFILRYQGLWAENDTAVFHELIGAVQSARSIDPPNAYPHGYAYQSVATTLLGLSGLDMTTFLQLYSPVLGTLMLALFGYVAYFRLLLSRVYALFATSVLFLVPEVLFTVLRGNHEKFTLGLSLLAALLVLRLLAALQRRAERRQVVAWFVALCVCLFTLDTLNLFFGSVFLSALTITLLLLVLTTRLLHLPVHRRDLLLLTGVAVTGWLLVALTLAVVYPASRGDFSLFTSAIRHAGSLLTRKASAVNPYAAIDSDWSSPQLYQLVTAFRFLLLGGALLSMVLELRDMGRQATVPLGRLLLVGLFAASLVQLASSIVIDTLGLESGSNLQVRMYPYVVLWASPLFALGLQRLSGSPLVRRSPLLWRGGLLALLAVLLVSSLLKSSLDPLLSNRWLGYRPGEVQAVQTWARQAQSSSLWVGHDGRVAFGYVMEHGAALAHGNTLSTSPTTKVQSAYALRSPLTDANNRVWKVPLPSVLLGDQIYDNGEAQVVWRHPVTQFQK